MLTFASGCVEIEPEGSDDAKIIHKTYGGLVVPEMQVQKLIVNSTSIVFTTSDAEGRFMKRYEKPFNKSGFEDLVSLFEKKGFFEMKDRYTPQEGQPVIADVGVLEIRLTEKERAKTVTVDPYSSQYMPEGLQEIDSALIELRAYALSAAPEEAEKIAETLIKSAPTYSFDGSGLKLEKHEVLETIPEKYILTYTFTSRHGGYGNRTGQMLIEALTPHRIEVTVSEKQVMSAVINGEWDELAQEPIGKGPDDFENTAGAEENLTEIKYLMPEGKTPWDRWYEEGNIEFIKASTPSELIIAYYGTVYEIEVSDVKKVEGCGLYSSCGGFYYVAKIKKSDFAKMKDLGWTDISEF